MKRLTVRMSDRLHGKLRAASRARDVSLNEVVTSAREQALDEGPPAEDERPSARDELTARLRLALGHLAEKPAKPTVSRPNRDLPIELPPGSKPLSHTIIEDREDRL